MHHRLPFLAIAFVLIAACSSGGTTLFSSIGASASTTSATGPSTSVAPKTTPGYAEYVTITDDSGAISVDVPVEWSELLGIPWDPDFEDHGLTGLIGPAVSATTDRDLWHDSSAPGVFIGASSQITGTIDEVLDRVEYTACEFRARVDYDDGTYTGKYDRWDNCGGSPVTMIRLIARPEGGEFTVEAQITIVDERDWAALDQVFRTFYVRPEAIGL